MLSLATTLSAAGVPFTISTQNIPMRPAGITEVSGVVVMTALIGGTVPAGSRIDVVYSVPITNNSTSSTNNISLANNLSCHGPSGGTPCPSSATLIDPFTIRLSFASGGNFNLGDDIVLSRVRVNSTESGEPFVTVDLSASSSDPINFPLTFDDPFDRRVGTLKPALSVVTNPGGPAVTSISSCNFQPGRPAAVEVREGTFNSFASLLQEIAQAPHLLPTSGTVLSVQLDNIPTGVSVNAPVAPFGTLLQLVPVNGGVVPGSGQPIIFNYSMGATDLTLTQSITIPYTLSLTGGGTVLNPVGTPVNITATVRIGPITNDDASILRFDHDQVGPQTVATISDCAPSPQAAQSIPSGQSRAGGA